MVEFSHFLHKIGSFYHSIDSWDWHDIARETCDSRYIHAISITFARVIENISKL